MFPQKSSENAHIVRYDCPPSTVLTHVDVVLGAAILRVTIHNLQAFAASPSKRAWCSIAVCTAISVTTLAWLSIEKSDRAIASVNSY